VEQKLVTSLIVVTALPFLVAGVMVLPFDDVLARAARFVM